MKRYMLCLMFITISYITNGQTSEAKKKTQMLYIELDEVNSNFAIFRNNNEKSILTQVIKKDERPYIHPIVAPDGNGVLTEYRPSHHIHQTGIYWGLKRVNERDYFMNWKSDYWQGVSAKIIEGKGSLVKWQTVYNMLDEKGNIILIETQNWSMQESDGKYFLDLEWRGEAKEDITMGKFYVGGLFVRMPWVKETIGKVINSSGQHNMEIEAQRAIWTDVGVKLDGRNDFAHIAIFDNPKNKAFPTPWRVDSQLGLGPSRQILGDWKLDKGETEVIRYRIIIYTGELDNAALTRLWTEYILN